MDANQFDESRAGWQSARAGRAAAPGELPELPDLSGNQDAGMDRFVSAVEPTHGDAGIGTPDLGSRVVCPQPEDREARSRPLA